MEGANNRSSLKHWMVIGLFLILAIIVFGLLWLFFLSPSNPSGLGWFLFSFAAGLSMIVLPCTLPLAFVIVPLSMGKGIKKGLGIAVSFALGITLTLSLYGIIAALVGRFAIDSLAVPLETIKNWVYFVAGVFALLFALGEVGLLKFRMPSYTGAVPAFIQRQQDFLKAFFLGLFLGNIGVGCPHPATPLILIEIASSGDVLYGWLLFFVHAIGRVLPLIFLAILGILGVNGLSWLVTRKDKVERATGWAMVFVAGFILTLGLFSHKWWVNSGIHTQLEKITQEETLLNIVRENLNSTVTHAHGIEIGTGLFGLPLWLGNWFMVTVWIIPIWWWWFRKKKDIKIINDSSVIPEKGAEEQVLSSNKYLLLAITALLALVFLYVLPRNFVYEQTVSPHEHAPGTPVEHPHDEDMMDGGQAHSSPYHEENEVTDGLVVNLLADASRVVGATSSLQFFVNEKPAGMAVDDLELERGKYIHIIGVRDDLSQFFHIHPDKISPGLWEVDHIFTESGVYKVWSDVTQGGIAHSFGHPVFAVSSSTSSASSTPLSISFAKNIVLGDYQVAISYPEPIVVGRDTNIDFAVKDVIGQGVILEPYLGATAHLAVIKDDLTVYLHTHPEEHGGLMEETNYLHESLRFIPQALAHGMEEGTPIIPASQISFNVNFPKAGIYKMFLQFRPEGIELPKDQSLVGEVYVNVFESGPAYPSLASVEEDDHSEDPPLSKPVLVFLSLVIIAFLGRAVYKFIQIKK